MERSRQFSSHSPTDWEVCSEWYNDLVSEEGHYYHKHVVVPKLLPLLDLKKSSSLLDLGCGQGFFSHAIPEEVSYVGMDLSPSLIQFAKKQSNKKNRFLVADICEDLPLQNHTFTHALFLLSLQNVAHPERALKNAAKYLEPKGTCVLVLNHPCFRIPRQSHWEVDAQKKLQYRRIDRYLTPLKIPIQTHPGKNTKASTTFSFHHSLSDFSRFLENAGFVMTRLEEWTSDKISTGKAANQENRARKEFPLFLAIKAEKR